jgi:farnesyl-diphosphate farnesyltransferase
MLSEKEKNYFHHQFPEVRDFWLEKVSRTFTLSIRILPHELRNYVGHAYLICRFLDSLEDASEVAIATKHKALVKAIKVLTENSADQKTKNYFKEFSTLQEFPKYEVKLLKNLDLLVKGLKVFPQEACDSINKWAIEMANGMKKYAFGKDENPFPHFNSEELEEYTYYVAGTVGMMLTELFQADCKIPQAKLQIMSENAIAFGKALQYVNIIKDSRADYQEGRCFIPDDLLKKYNISKEEFFNKNSQNTDAVKNVYKNLFDKAWLYLNKALAYIKAIPSRYWRVRLFCIWPIILAAKTLISISENLDSFITGSTKYKITRPEVKRSVLFSYPAGFSNTYLNILLKKNKWNFYA